MKGQKEVQRVEAQRVHDIMATELVPTSSGIAIDGGAHVGSWTVEMSQYFDKVYAFEPCQESYDMLTDNVAVESSEHCTVIARRQALVDKPRTVDSILPPGKRQTLTARQVKLDGTELEGVTIDGLDLPGCDLIKLDLEGAEWLALVGAKETIRKYKPFLVLEFNGLVSQFGHSEGQIIRKLQAWGYAEVWRDGVDRGYACKQQS